MVVKTAKPCVEDKCPHPRSKRSTKWCVWHWLKRQPATTQSEFAAYRLGVAENKPGYTFRARVPAEEWPEGKRWCSGCQTMVPLFYCRGSRCVACESKAAHENRVTDQYGLEPGQYDRILEAQGRRCAICRGRPISVRLAVDHDHSHGSVRGLLCSRCNHELLGAAHDSPRLLLRALAYLLAPPAGDAEAWRERLVRLGLEFGVELTDAAPAESPFAQPSRGLSRARAGTPY